MSYASRDLMFEGMSRPVRLEGCDELIPHLPLIFPGWQIDSLDGSSSSPVLRLARDGRVYCLTGDWLSEPLQRHEAVDALCALVAEVMRAYVRQDDKLLCLHGAAAVFNGRLVVFPSQYRAGKSILGACLAARGTRLFCDDILPLRLDSGAGIAPGLAPRLRLPLPENLTQTSRQFIESRIGLRGRHYAYLDLNESLLAARGEQLPIGAFVLLDRQAGASAGCESVDEAEVLAQVVWQNFAREADAPVILEVLHRLVSGARFFRLRYDRAEDAVDLLHREFSRWPERDAVPDLSAATSKPADMPAIELPPGYYRQSPGISMIDVENRFFLADRQGAAIHQLNAIGSSIWGLLAEPVSLEEIVDILLNAFPDLERKQVEADVGSLLAELKGKNLLESGAD